MCVFEATPQRLQNYDRLNAAWNRIDALTTALGLHNIDAGNRDVFVIERSAQSGTYLDSLCRLNMTTSVRNGILSLLSTAPSTDTISLSVTVTLFLPGSIPHLAIHIRWEVLHPRLVPISTPPAHLHVRVNNRPP